MGRAWWPDPRSLVPERGRREWEGDEGFDALMDSLHKAGPREVPNREKAADIAGRSVGTFRREFPLFSGLKWREFITAWRVVCGHARLETTFDSLKEVAHASGYRSVQGFSRAYRGRFGSLPRSRRRGSD